MKTYITMNHKSSAVRKAHQEKLNENKSAKYQFLLQEGAKVSIPLEVQLERFKKGLKK